MSAAPTQGFMGPPAEVERQIRSRGAVLDMAFTQSIYAPLLARQPRDGASVTRDLVYGTDDRHRMDVYRPQAGDAAGRDVILFFHGGGFVRGDKAEKENIGQYFARLGMVVAIANYRLAPKHVWPSGAEDVTAAYRWLRANVAALGGRPERIFLVGESAGAAHVATAALVRRFHPPEGLVTPGLVLISGVYDAELELRARRQFKTASPDPRNEPYYGSDFARYREMSTVHLIDAAPAPVLITYAELDLPQMQVQAGGLFACLITKHGFDPDLHVVPGHNHLTQVYSVNTGDESLTHIVADFMSKHRP
ncbi:MAG TPA: alpha/beta hydrolase [Steroidobacteraceae bacterium]|nr:alpha/beta hydrolase [Steroidobacteraceae bacterium]